MTLHLERNQLDSHFANLCASNIKVGPGFLIDCNPSRASNPSLNSSDCRCHSCTESSSSSLNDADESVFRPCQINHRNIGISFG